MGGALKGGSLAQAEKEKQMQARLKEIYDSHDDSYIPYTKRYVRYAKQSSIQKIHAKSMMTIIGVRVISTEKTQNMCVSLIGLQRVRSVGKYLFPKELGQGIAAQRANKNRIVLEKSKVVIMTTRSKRNACVREEINAKKEQHQGGPGQRHDPPTGRRNMGGSIRCRARPWDREAGPQICLCQNAERSPPEIGSSCGCRR